MFKKVMIVFMVLLFSAALGAETKVIPLPDLLKPDQILYFDKTQMYVPEGTSIYIYSLKDFKLVKKFGKQGQGPQEFMLSPRMGAARLFLSVHTEDITVYSVKKVSWFTKDGKFKKESVVPNPLIGNIAPFGKKFLGIKVEFGQEGWMILKLFDDKFNDVKEIIKKPYPMQRGKGLRLLESVPLSFVYENKLFTAWEKDFLIKVLDINGSELYTIKRDEKKRKVTEDLKKKVIDYLKVAPETKDAFEFLKPFHFPEYLPSIFGLTVTGNKIYAVTFHEDDAEDDECLIMDLKGKLLKRVFLPLKMSTPLLQYPYFIREGSIYQIVENEEEEQWEMHITEIK